MRAAKPNGMGGPYKRRRKRPNKQLTAREREVLNAIARGLERCEIARALGVSASAVGKHRGRILGKIGAASTAEMVHYAIWAGITPLMEFDPDDVSRAPEGRDMLGRDMSRPYTRPYKR